MAAKTSPFGDLPQKKRSVTQRIISMVHNIYSMRQRWLQGSGFDKRRCIEDEAGHPNLSEYYIDPEEYRNLFHRDPISNRVVSFLPKECWQLLPWVYEDEDPETETEFEKRWSEIMTKTFSEGSNKEYRSFYKDPKASTLWDYLKRLDIMSGIGHYGLLLIGINDGLPLNKPAKLEAGEVRHDITYMRVIPEYLAQINQVENNTSSPRYNMPTYYQVTFNDPRIDAGALGYETGTTEVHWSRVIHVAEEVDPQESYGTPRMRAVLNRLLDLKKIYGSHPEMYYKGAFPGLFLGTDPALGGDVDVDDDEVSDEIEQYMNGLQRVLTLVGFKPEQLAPQVVDPSPHIERQLEAICIQKGYPKRKFMGSERGQLASSQDDADWNSRLVERNECYTNPRIIAPTVDRLIMLGVLPAPTDGFSIKWPDLTNQTASEKSAVTFQLTQALAQYITSGAHLLMSPVDYFVTVWSMPELEAIAITQKVKESEEYKKALAMWEEAKLTKEYEMKEAAKNDQMKREPGKGGRTGEPPNDSSNSAGGRIR